MNGFRRLIACLCVFVLFPAHVWAQQVNVKGEGESYPTGVTVVASGTANVTDWVSRIAVSYNHKAGSGTAAYAAAQASLGQLRAAMEKIGLGDAVGDGVATYMFNGQAGQLVGIAVATATLRVPTDRVQEAISAIQAVGWKLNEYEQDKPTLEPRDPDAASNAAFKAAVAVARSRAEAIAQADGRHVGKLLNVTPLPEYYYTQPYPLTSNMTVPKTGSSVTEGAVFTFELLP